MLTKCSITTTWLLTLLVFSGRCLARNFKYARALSLDEYRHYKDGFSGGTVGTLFMHYPAQIFSCDLPFSYKRFSDFVESIGVNDVFENARLRAGKEDDFFGYVSHELLATWSSCYQNFITRYCMYLITTRDRLFPNRVRMCKHMYFPKTPENLRPVAYLVREVKPYINFHMREHILGEHAGTFDKQGLYPLGLEYLLDWNYMGYASTPEIAYDNMQRMGSLHDGYIASAYDERVHGRKEWPFASFTLLADLWTMKLMQIVHEVYWTSARNNRGGLTHELTNAYQDFEHIQLHYLTHVCAKLLTQKPWKGEPTSINQPKPPDIFDIDMCPNPCRQPGVCAGLPHTSGSDCRPTGLGKRDFKCECTAGYAWNEQSLTCDESFDCNQDCTSYLTRFCSFVPAMELSAKEAGHDGLISREGHLRCECFPQIEGQTCDRRRDACSTGAEGKRSGNELCRVDYGGNCTAAAGTTHYVCSCPKGFRNLKSIREDNCLAKRTACDSIICANNGACHSSPDGEAFECQCTPGFEGRLCEHQIVYQWTYWSDWSACDSLCGQGWQSSHRICWDRQIGHPDARSRCLGNNETLRVCHKHCLTEIQTSYYMAIGLLIELLFRMMLATVSCFLFAKILFDLLFREVDYVFVRYLRSVLLDLVRRAVGARNA